MIRSIRNRPRVAAAVLAAIVAGVGTARAQDDGIRFDATEKLEYRRLHQDDGTREEAFRNRLEVSGYQGIFSAWVRLESLQISAPAVYDPYRAPGSEGTQAERVDETKVTRRMFTAQTDRFRVQAGDVSHVFGRGLALSVFEDEELNFDTRLEGVRTQYEADRGTAAAVLGSKDGNRFRGLFVESTPVALGGTGAQARAGASFVEAWGGTENTDIRPREQHAGGLLDVTAGPVGAYGEYVERKFPGKDGLGVLGTPGHGAFVAGHVTAKDVTLSGEYRDFYRFEHKYHDPPTTLRQQPWTSLNRVNGQVLADIPDDDVNGTLVQLEWVPGTFTAVQGSWAHLDEDDGADEFTERYAEAKSTWRERVFVTGAAADSKQTLGSAKEERISGMTEIVGELDGVNSLGVTVEWTEVQDTDSFTQAFRFPERFRERIASVSWGRSPWLSLTLTHEDTTEDTGGERDDWTNLLAEISVASGHDVILAYGSEKGGWKCTGGVCFYEPEFEGLKVKWIGRF